MSKIITFTNISEFDNLKQPEPASKCIPDWYKDLQSYLGGEKKPSGNGRTVATVKKCMPVFDAITAGYIIKLPADIYVSKEDGQQKFEWASYNLINFHSILQAPTHPLVKPHDYAKFMNPWAIETPKGYSTLFVQPFHRESVFTILPGVVDTDGYNSAVNFPFVMNDPNFEGLIPADTPIAQVIPFKRDNWVMKIGKKDGLRKNAISNSQVFKKFYDGYKNAFHIAKSYK